MSGIYGCYIYYSSTCQVLTGAIYIRFYVSGIDGCYIYYSYTCLVFTGALYIIVVRVGY